mmetsp:Transcript_35338/g.45565  ORF Transcript_35338/g.45565 Transcript_35338/m.45565 type:complete len:309 (+) Transcript_35338:85-1011(+)
MSDKQRKSLIKKVSPSYLAGFISGLANAGIFNWYDKALYESVKNKRPFLNLENFKHPWQGFQAAIVGRVLSYGMFFPISESFQTYYGKYITKNPELLRFISSQSTGVLISLPLAPISSIKYRMWGSKHGYMKTAIEMWKVGGIYPFFQGISPTLYRDCCWASSFVFAKHHSVQFVRKQFNNTTSTSTTRKNNHNNSSSSLTKPSISKLQSSLEFTAVAFAGAFATALSSPFNYVRNLVYSSHPSINIPSVWKSLHLLLKDFRKQSHPYHFLQQRLNIGWGTTRVALGMAVSNYIYEWTKDQIQEAQRI